MKPIAKRKTTVMLSALLVMVIGFGCIYFRPSMPARLLNIAVTPIVSNSLFIGECKLSVSNVSSRRVLFEYYPVFDVAYSIGGIWKREQLGPARVNGVPWAVGTDCFMVPHETESFNIKIPTNAEVVKVGMFCTGMSWRGEFVLNRIGKRRHSWILLMGGYHLLTSDRHDFSGYNWSAQTALMPVTPSP